MEDRKLCISCGEDVTHKARHKNRHGEYVCPPCRKAKKASSLARSLEMTRNKLGLVVFCVAVALLSCWIFWTVLQTMNQPGAPDL